MQHDTTTNNKTMFDALEDDPGLTAAVYSFLSMAYLVFTRLPRPRKGSPFAQRLYWAEYCDSHVRRGTFKRRLRMSKKSFDKLLGYIREPLEVDERRAKSRGGPIIPEVCLNCTIRYLAGGSYLDICDVAGISKASFYRVIWKTMRIINATPALRIHFPKTTSQLSKAISDFTTISFGDAVVNCVGVIDGYLCRIKVPSKKEAGNVRSYFSGHYQCYGVNVQAVADHHSRFLFIGLAAPGVTADRDALLQCEKLYDAIESLPLGFCIIGDAAYEATEHMVPVYQGIEKTIKKYDNFNFFASQLRIRIEMAFGLMQMKFGILQRPLGCKLKNVSVLLHAIGRLHNFVINERLGEAEEPEIGIPASQDAIRDANRRYLASMPVDEDGDPIDLDAIFGSTKRSGHSDLREWMVERIAARPHLVRPESNRIAVRNPNRGVAIEVVVSDDDDDN